jgi:hypothetical protein
MYVLHLLILLVLHMLIFAKHNTTLTVKATDTVQQHDRFDAEQDTADVLPEAAVSHNRFFVPDADVRIFGAAFAQAYSTPLYVEKDILQQVLRRTAAKLHVLLAMHPAAAEVGLDEGLVCSPRLSARTVFHYRAPRLLAGRYAVVLSTYSLNEQGGASLASRLRQLYRLCAPGGYICCRLLLTRPKTTLPSLQAAMRQAGFRRLRTSTVHMAPLMLADMSYAPQLLMSWWSARQISLRWLAHSQVIVLGRKLPAAQHLK